MCWTFLLCYRDRYPQCNCAGCKAVIAGDPAPRAVSSFRLAHDARHHGRHAMEGQLPDFMVVSVFCALLGSTLDTCCVVRCTRSRAGNTAGRACSQLQLRSSPCCCSQSLWMVGPSLPLLRRYLVLFVGSFPCCRGVCVAMSCCGGFFTPDGAYDSVWDYVKPLTGKYFFNFSSTKSSLGVYAC